MVDFGIAKALEQTALTSTGTTDPRQRQGTVAAARDVAAETGHACPAFAEPAITVMAPFAGEPQRPLAIPALPRV
jgi:hypothetical protein